jgi:hypothetical protein
MKDDTNINKGTYEQHSKDQQMWVTYTSQRLANPNGIALIIPFHQTSNDV